MLVSVSAYDVVDYEVFVYEEFVYEFVNTLQKANHCLPKCLFMKVFAYESCCRRTAGCSGDAVAARRAILSDAPNVSHAGAGKACGVQMMADPLRIPKADVLRIPKGISLRIPRGNPVDP